MPTLGARRRGVPAGPGGICPGRRAARVAAHRRPRRGEREGARSYFVSSQVQEQG